MSREDRFRVYHILFLSRRNSGRSIMAEALMNRLGTGRFEAHSAGFEPHAEVHPMVRGLLEKVNYRTSILRPKPASVFTRADAPDFDFIFRLSNDFPTSGGWPKFKGEPMLIDWHLPDPELETDSKALMASAYADMFNTLATRIEGFTRMPIESLDHLKLADRLETLGEYRHLAA